jgi:hypothetical protein
MSIKIKIIFIFFICICLQNIHALDVEITDKETEILLNADFNRTFNFVGGISGAGKIELNDRLAFKGGVFIGWTENVTNIKFFTNAAFQILADQPLEAKLAWVYNGLPEYEAHSHAIAPVVSWNDKYWGISAGFGFRFTSFFGEPALLEYILPLGVYVNFINNEKICAGVSLANFNDFRAGSFITFALTANVSVKINEQWSIVNELEYRHSGGDGLTATFHGITWRGGAKFTW